MEFLKLCNFYGIFEIFIIFEIFVNFYKIRMMYHHHRLGQPY